MSGANLQGYASLYNTPYSVGGYTEVIERGAFRRTLTEKPDVPLLINHGAGSSIPLARSTAGTLRLSEDDLGLRVDADLDPTRSDVADLIKAMRRGDFDGQMSFAFRVADGGQTWSEDFTRRTISRCDIDRGDVSLVTHAASPTTFSAITERSADRRSAAKAIGRKILCSTPFTAEVRSVAGGNIEIHLWPVETRAPSGRKPRVRQCARCSGKGKIKLSGRKVRCPNCCHSKLPGYLVNSDAPHMSTQADGSSRSYEARLLALRDETATVKSFVPLRGPSQKALEALWLEGRAFRRASGLFVDTSDPEAWQEAVDLVLTGDDPDTRALRLHLIDRHAALGLPADWLPTWERDTGKVRP